MGYVIQSLRLVTSFYDTEVEEGYLREFVFRCQGNFAP